MEYLSYFEPSVAALREERRYRVFANLERQVGSFPRALCRGAAGTQEIVVWCSNDYLGMGQHRRVVDAMCEAARATGAEAGGTRNISCTSSAIVELEREIADLHGNESALV